MGAKGGNDVATVHRWTGLEAAALRAALRMSVRSFAEHLGVAPRTIAKWEKYRAATEPYPDNQAILDTALARADPAVHMRFEVLLSEAGQATGQIPRVTAAGPRLWEYETWSEDLERCVVALNRQNFGFARSLLTRWSARWPVGELDDRGLYLLGRTTVLEADLYRDQGFLLGPMSAQSAYAKGRQIFTQLDIPRRIAQIELSQAVVAEMSGKLDARPRPAVGRDRTQQGRQPGLRGARHARRQSRLRGPVRARRLVRRPAEAGPGLPRLRRPHPCPAVHRDRPHDRNHRHADAARAPRHRARAHPALRPGDRR